MCSQLQFFFVCCALHREALPNNTPFKLATFLVFLTDLSQVPFFLSHSTDIFSLDKLTHLYDISIYLFTLITPTPLYFQFLLMTPDLKGHFYLVVHSLTPSSKLTIHPSDIYSNFFMDIFFDPPNPDMQVIICILSLLLDCMPHWTYSVQPAG